MTQFSIIIGDRGFLRQGVGIAGVDGGQGDGGWGHRVFVRTPRAAGCDAWKTTSLWGWPCVEDDFVAGVAMYGRRLRCGTRRRPVCDCCSTLTEALLPTTCVVVNKPPALKHFPTTGAAPRLSESRSRVPRNRRSDVPLRGACPMGEAAPFRGMAFSIFCGCSQGKFSQPGRSRGVRACEAVRGAGDSCGDFTVAVNTS